MKPFKKFVLSVATLILGVSVVSCGGNNQPAAKKIDYAHNGSLTLSKDYQNVDFYKDAIGEFTLWTCIDGDTAHFSPVVTTTSRNIVKSRFLGIDTPESTGRVQPYGKQASNFTKEHLKNAANFGTIVIEGVYTDGGPKTDSNGRQLSCIWIHESKKNAPYNELINLNLWILQEGLAAISSFDDIPQYEEVFMKAFKQAKTLKLKMHSGKPDPLFNYGDYEDAYIPDIAKEVNKKLKDQTYQNPYDGMKVRIEGTVVGYSGGIIYLQKYDDPDLINTETGEPGDGTFYTINVFCGMAAVPGKYTKFGTVLKIMGLCGDGDFGFQVQDVEGHFPQTDDEELVGENDVQILVRAKNNTVDPKLMPHINYLTAAELSAIAAKEDLSILNSPVQLVKESGESAGVPASEKKDALDESKLDPITVYRCKPNQNKDKWTIKLENPLKFDLYITSAYRGDPNGDDANWTSDEQWKGKSMGVVRGIYTYHSYTDQDTGEKTYSYQIVFSSVNGGDLLWLDRTK